MRGHGKELAVDCQRAGQRELAGTRGGVAKCGAMKWTTSAKRVLSSPLLCMAVACGGGAPAGDAKKVEEVKAEPKKEEEDAGVKKRREEREAKAAAAKKAEEDAVKKIEEITVLPAKLPKKLDKACDEVSAAFDGFMKRAASDPASWDSKKGTTLGMMKKDCMGGKIEVAACEISAFGAATPELVKSVPAIISKCMEKFGNKPAG